MSPFRHIWAFWDRRRSQVSRPSTFTPETRRPPPERSESSTKMHALEAASPDAGPPGSVDPPLDALHGPSATKTTPSSAGQAIPDLNELFDLYPVRNLVLSPDRRITRASVHFLQTWNITKERCVGQELSSFLADVVGPSNKNTPSVVTQAIDEAIASRAEKISEPVFVRLAQITKWNARVIPAFRGDDLVALVVEWQELPSSPDDVELAKGLSTNEAFPILVQAVKDYAIFLLDVNGNVATWNTGAELHKGYTKDEIVGKHFSIFYGKEDLDARKPQMELEICLREGRVEDEGWRYRKDGTRFWANVIITAVYKDGVHVGFGKVTRDLTERKAAESRLIEAYEESEKLKSDFLANMSHEIRTPMHGMLSACALLLDTQLTEKQRDIANIMDESGQVLLQVINDILDYSKLQSGTFSINTDVVGIASIITSVVRNTQTTLQPSVYFELLLSPDLPKSAQGDPLRYRQVVQNIVGNAAKFTDKGYIRVRLTLQEENTDGYVVLTEITDTGIGISEESAKGLFLPFTQFDNTTRKRYKGTGLGLSIAKSLTELMGGQIGYRPNPERQGSSFWFTTKFKRIKSLDQAPGSWKDQPNSNNPSRQQSPVVLVEDPKKKLAPVSPRKTLLVVEDNLINQKVMVGMLRALGFKQIDLASNGAEAVSMVRAKPAAYDLVLMDINMPIVDGFDATIQIRESGIHVPIIAMTAYALKGDRERCLERGMDDYVPKPVDKKYLVKTLVKWLMEADDYRTGNHSRSPFVRQQSEHGTKLTKPATVVPVRTEKESDDKRSVEDQPLATGIASPTVPELAQQVPITPIPTDSKVITDIASEVKPIEAPDG